IARARAQEQHGAVVSRDGDRRGLPRSESPRERVALEKVGGRRGPGGGERQHQRQTARGRQGARAPGTHGPQSNHAARAGGSRGWKIRPSVPKTTGGGPAGEPPAARGRKSNGMGGVMAGSTMPFSFRPEFEGELSVGQIPGDFFTRFARRVETGLFMP